MKSVDRKGRHLVGNLDNGELLVLDLGDGGAPREGGAEVHPAQGHRRRVLVHPGRPDPPRRPAGTAEAFVVASDALADEVPAIATGGLDPVADAVSWTSFARVHPGPLDQAEGPPHGPRGGGRHRPDLQRRDPLGGGAAPRPHLQRAVHRRRSGACSGPSSRRSTTPSSTAAPRSTTTRSSTSTASRATTRTSSRCTAARASRAAAAGPRSRRPATPTSPCTTARRARSDGCSRRLVPRGH